MQNVILGAVGLLLAAAIVAFSLWRHDRAALWVGSVGCALACATGAAAALVALLSSAGGDVGGSDWVLAWPLALGSLHVGLDALSAFFLLCVFTVSGLAAVYGLGYMAAYIGQKRLAPPVALFNILVAAMALVVLARDGVMFLIAWEVMSLSSFFLVTFESARAEVRRAGLVYLIASHVGVAFLFVLFALLAKLAGSFDFNAFAGLGARPGGFATLAFVLALVGFGTKAGFWPVHVWLPDAHPAAPSHVSAVMSGVMIKLGIYGLLRTLTFLGPTQAWWGVTFIAIGAVSGVIGVLHALAQHDLKRMLAYSSVENIGIIALGLGVGLFGQAHNHPTVAFFGFAGALLHVLNHGLFKGVLFAGAGSLLHATHQRSLNAQGGLLKRMPRTGLAFLVAAMAICGLPPLNGFASEFLIYLGAFRGSSAFTPGAGVLAVLALVALSLIGGLAAACFVRAFGLAFLGEPRTEAAALAHEAGRPMQAAMLLGALLCGVIGVFPLGALLLVRPAVAVLGPQGLVADRALTILSSLSLVAALVALGVGALALLRWWLLRGREVSRTVTWGCGYAAPSARMQYTAQSFAEPLIAPFATALAVRTQQDGPTGRFPRSATYEQHWHDRAGEQLLEPLVQWSVRQLSRLSAMQHGRIQLYLVYILLTLVAVLVWQFAGPFGG